MNCIIDGCNHPAKVRDLCGAHYQKAWRTGTLDYVAAPHNLNAPHPRQAERMRALWQDPDYRARVVAAQRTPKGRRRNDGR